MGHFAVRDRLLRRLEELSPDQQAEVLDFVERLDAPRRGVSTEELKRFSGILDKEAAQEMMEAIEEGCERVNPDEW